VKQLFLAKKRKKGKKVKGRKRKNATKNGRNKENGKGLG